MRLLLILSLTLLITACATKREPARTPYDFQIYKFIDARDNKAVKPLFNPTRDLAYILKNTGEKILFGRQQAMLFPTLKTQSVSQTKGPVGEPLYELSYTMHFRATDTHGTPFFDQDLTCVAKSAQPFDLPQLLGEMKETLSLPQMSREDRILHDLSRKCLADFGRQLGGSVM